MWEDEVGFGAAKSFNGWSRVGRGDGCPEGTLTDEKVVANSFVDAGHDGLVQSAWPPFGTTHSYR